MSNEPRESAQAQAPHEPKRLCRHGDQKPERERHPVDVAARPEGDGVDATRLDLVEALVDFGELVAVERAEKARRLSRVATSFRAVSSSLSSPAAVGSPTATVWMTMPLSFATPAASAGGTLLAVSLPSVRRDDRLRLDGALVEQRDAEADRIAEGGARLPPCRRRSRRGAFATASRSVVNGTSVKGASPNTTTPTRSPLRRSRKSPSTCFTAARRSTVLPDGSTKSLVSIEPERSTSSSRSRVGSSR